MSKIAQEFYCNDCDGYILVKLNISLNRRIQVKCPSCGRLHPRAVKEGLIVESYHDTTGDTENIVPTKAAYSKTSLLDTRASRGGVTPDNKIAPEVMARWVERFGARV
jgi:hypothetical protein